MEQLVRLLGNTPEARARLGLAPEHELTPAAPAQTTQQPSTEAATEQPMPPAAGPCAVPQQPMLAPTHLPLVVPFSAMALIRAAAVSLGRAAGEFLAAVDAHPHAPPAPCFGGPRSASPQNQQQRQVKARLGPEDGMEEELRQPESAATQLHVQNASAFEDPTADQQQQQPNQQTHQLAVVPFERDASEGPGTLLACSPVAAVGLKKREARRQHKLLMEQLDAEEREARAVERGADAPMPPAMPGNAPMQQPAPQTQPAPKQQPKRAQQPAPKKQTQPQAPKQPQQQQPPKQPAQQQTPKQPLYASVLAATCGAMTAAVCQSLAPPGGSSQTQPQAQQPGQWQQQTHQRKAQRGTQSKQQQQNTKQPRDSGAVGLDRFSHLLHFTLSGEKLDVSGSPREVVGRVVARAAGEAAVQVVDVVRRGPAARPRFLFKVATLEQAEALVTGRGAALAGSGVILSEVLTAAEAARHTQLWPIFLQHQREGHKVQFKRARLFVNGSQWTGVAAG